MTDRNESDSKRCAYSTSGWLVYCKRIKGS